MSWYVKFSRPKKISDADRIFHSYPLYTSFDIIYTELIVMTLKVIILKMLLSRKNMMIPNNFFGLFCTHSGD